MFIVFNLDCRVSTGLAVALGVKVTGIEGGSVRHPEDWQLLKTCHHLSNDCLWHLSSSGGRRQGRVMMMRIGVLHSSNSSICWHTSVGHLLEPLSDFLQGAVDLKLWALAEGLLAKGTLVIF